MSRASLRILILVAALTPGATALAAQASLVILVRHAEKAAAGSDPLLTPAGEARAAALVATVAQVPFGAVIATQFRRTRHTARPVAEAQGLTTITVEAGRDISAHAVAVARAVNALPAGSAVLVVGHSNTLGPIIAQLGGPALPDLCDAEYSTLFVLERGGPVPRLLRTRFGAPEPEGTDRCGPGA